MMDNILYTHQRHERLHQMSVNDNREIPKKTIRLIRSENGTCIDLSLIAKLTQHEELDIRPCETDQTAM